MWNGRAVLVTLSEESETGFLNVLKQPGGRKKPFYVKFKPDGEKRQRTLPGSSSGFGLCMGGSLKVRLLPGNEGRAARDRGS